MMSLFINRGNNLNNVCDKRDLNFLSLSLIFFALMSSLRGHSILSSYPSYPRSCHRSPFDASHGSRFQWSLPLFFFSPTLQQLLSHRVRSKRVIFPSMRILSLPHHMLAPVPSCKAATTSSHLSPKPQEASF
jgi:hypothetical protein